MLERVMFRSFLVAPPSVRSGLFRTSQRSFLFRATAPYSSDLQSITQPSFWKNLVPKPLRKSEREVARNTKKKAVSKDWNPATFYIWMFLLIGSMSIQMIALKNQHTTFSRRADAKIELLREVIERIQNGEDVDVEGLLGTGNAQQEKEWEEILKDIEREDELWNESRKKPIQRKDSPAVQPQPETLKQQDSAPKAETVKAKSTAPRGFY